ncbi:uncharacterized protein LOC133890167 isoform X1 [Phragmites australis]|uniref:uncharacterized protein LOC133890167 isoform X1 n=1 Tax=Phragmites australis TaxID=29695 RepID=UPI002D79F14F|nr:uncharacterized protein LOC133890167 isoform X1 [Phragmites australis]XP_062186601.1 uncharacterized protein LOC133890167 isoform X1 [Phragmites australis]XP_062186602.1 uncharacterized protein LOC133890167 isoform X1 [Phragmites australis]
MKLRLHLLVLCVIIIFLVYNMANYQHRQTTLEAKSRPFDTVTVSDRAAVKVSEKAVARIGYLPHSIVEPYSDMELKPLWLTRSAQSQQESNHNDRCLIAIAAGINQKKNVDAIMKKFLLENFTAILFHYDGNVNEWNDLPWSKSVIHIAASNQTKWWFAKRFLHPAVVSMYQYIFLWDEDLEVDNFNPRRYLNIVKSEGLEISQPGLDSKLSEIHHRITVRKKTGSFHRRVSRANKECSREGPPCSGWVEGMAPVFSKSSWQCAWHLIQNDLIHGWGIDYKFGYCAQGDRTKNIGVVDSEFIVHRGVQTLGGSAIAKDGTHGKNTHPLRQKTAQVQQTRARAAGLDMRTKVRRKSRSELLDFQKRWDRAAREDKTWVDPFARSRQKRRNRIQQ